jgi:hypothetical protein
MLIGCAGCGGCRQAGEVGEELRRAMIARRGAIAGLQGSDREEAADEVHFWDMLEVRGLEEGVGVEC